MKFGAIDPRDALGAINVHTLRAGTRVIKKGRVLGADDIAALVVADTATVVCAQIEPGELGEDVAAAWLARAVAGAHVAIDEAHTGRANLRAAAAGVLVIDRDAIARINVVDEALTVATIAPDSPVRAGDIIATIKVIPFAVPGPLVEAAADVATAISVAPFELRRAGLVLTRFSATHESVLDRAAQTQRTRLERIGSSLARELRVPHDRAAVAAALRELAAAGLDPILAMGASAIVDRRDVIPAALEDAGGAILRYGMPVDPGNLLLLGSLGASTVIGLPGCARSLERSGFDWVLERECANLPITAAAVGALGVGGLLVAGPRPFPIVPSTEVTSDVAAVVLAAGHSSRMGANKLLVELDGRTLVHHAVAAALASRASEVVVVTGNDADRVRAALAGLNVRFVHNAEFATGMASSLRAGVAAVANARAAAICLGDMPRVTAAHLDALIAAFSAAADERAIIVPAHERKRGNPVVWGRAHFPAIAELAGDVGARSLIERNLADVRMVALDDAILVDVDTPDALQALKSSSQNS
ncbi:MAG TPA: NTP transferase domain-containing protein [Kofleriaceae bacterium]|nr:NTP transferase domain-containing protein [Kofleriaceae bacterium]